MDHVDRTMARVIADCAAVHPRAVNLLSGGVDSSLIQVFWNRAWPQEQGRPETFTVSLDHPRSRPDAEYALSAAKALGTRHTLVPAAATYADYLRETIAGTGEPPNHVQAIYFRYLARVLAARGIEAALCGEGADSLFGVGLTSTLQMALLLRKGVPAGFLRRVGSRLASGTGHPSFAACLDLAGRIEDLDNIEHPINQVAVFTDLPAVTACFGAHGVVEGLRYRQRLLDQYQISNNPIERLNFSGFLGEASDSGALWTTLFNQEGCEMLCPFLDSRMIGLAVSILPKYRYPFGKPKELLKQVLRRHAPPLLAGRSKLGFGQPVFEWLAPGGSLHSLVQQIGHHDFVSPDVLAGASSIRTGSSTAWSATTCGINYSLKRKHQSQWRPSSAADEGGFYCLGPFSSPTEE